MQHNTLDYNPDYWKGYYNEHSVPETPTSFATFCFPYIRINSVLLDVGCGNGRDAKYFNSMGIKVVAWDIADKYSKELHNVGINFGYCDLSQKRDWYYFYEYIYCRFLLHAVPKDVEEHILRQAYIHLLEGGLLFIEARSDKGVEPNHTPHYRRLINADKLLASLDKFKIIYFAEGTDFAVYHDENPIIIRIIAQKQ